MNHQSPNPEWHWHLPLPLSFQLPHLPTPPPPPHPPTPWTKKEIRKGLAFILKLKKKTIIVSLSVKYFWTGISKFIYKLHTCTTLWNHILNISKVYCLSFFFQIKEHICFQFASNIFLHTFWGISLPCNLWDHPSKQPREQTIWNAIGS